MPDLAYLSLLKKLTVPEPDYIVFTEDGTVKAKNVKTLEVEYQSNDAGEILNYVISKIPGGVVYIKRGVYNVHTQVVISNKNGIVLIGEIPVTGVLPQPGATRLNLSATIDSMIRVENSNNVVLVNLEIYGNQEGGVRADGVVIESSSNVIITHTRVCNFDGTGIVVSRSRGVKITDSVIGGGDSRYASDIGVNWFPNNVGVLISGSTHVDVSRSYIVSNYVEGIRITSERGYTGYIEITNSFIMWNGDNPGYGIYIYRAWSDFVEEIVIANNIIAENYAAGVRIENYYKLYGYGCGFIVITGNNFNSNGLTSDGANILMYAPATADPVWEVVIVGNRFGDSVGANIRPVYAERARSLLLASNTMTRQPVIRDCENTLVTDSPIDFDKVVWSNIPYLTELPWTGYFTTGSLVLYYDGTAYKICAVTPAGWKCATLS